MLKPLFLCTAKDAALAQTRADRAAGRFVQESAQAHVARLDKLA